MLHSTAQPLDCSRTSEDLGLRANGDFEAFAELYRRYQCAVYRFVLARVRDAGTAEDLTAHIFFKALNGAGGYRADAPYAAWLFTIARNTVATWRASNERAALVVEQMPEEEDPVPEPATQVMVDEARRVVWSRVSGLPPAQAEVVTLRYLRELSIEEVARDTGRTRGAVRILLHKARRRLRRELEGEEVR